MREIHKGGFLSKKGDCFQQSPSLSSSRYPTHSNITVNTISHIDCLLTKENLPMGI